MKKILVPCDFSQTAVEAVKFASTVAQKSKGEVVLLHTIELPTLYDSSAVLSFEAEYMKDAKEKALGKLKALATKWIEPKLKVKYNVEFGGFIPTLNAAIDDTEADLIVMGTHGASGLKEYTIGSNAEKVVRNSKVPVICVRKASANVKNIVFPTAPDREQEDLMMKVKALQEFFSAKLHVVFINTPAGFTRDSETRPMLEKLAKRYMLKNYETHVYSDIDESQGIINFTRTVKGDLVAMRTHGRKGILHLATGSVAEDVVNHVHCPIWTYKVK